MFLINAFIDLLRIDADATKRQDIDDNLEQEWDALLNKIKEDLDPLGLDFAHTKDEETGITVWALVRLCIGLRLRCIVEVELYRSTRRPTTLLKSRPTTTLMRSRSSKQL